MDHPWDQLPNASAKAEYLEFRVALNAEVDEILEQCMREHCALSLSFGRVFECLAHRLGAKAVFVRTVGESLQMETFALGVSSQTLEGQGLELFETTSPQQISACGQNWFVAPLDLAGVQIGTFGVALDPEQTRPNELVFDLMSAVAEELDQFFFAIQEGRRKQLAIESIQLALKNPILVRAVDSAVAVLDQAIPASHLLLLYLDEDVGGSAQIQYIVYEGSKKAFDSVDRPMVELDRLVRLHGTGLLESGDPALAGLFPSVAVSESKLIDGLVKMTVVGKLIVRPRHGSEFSMANREIIQIFTEALRLRLVDFNHEKRILRKSFSPEVTRKLIRAPDYVEAYLTARARDVGILYADLSGFTLLCEQILKTPERIGEFIHGWSYGAVERVYEQGGAFDKMVGDCIIGIFGPPFFDQKPTEVVQTTLKAAIAIRDFTREYFESAKNADIRKHPRFGDMGVSIGVNYCHANVGLFGPDHGYTCFSSGMNNTARLQGLAKAYQILIMKDMDGLVEPNIVRTGPMRAKVKNVGEPIEYFVIE